MYAVHTNHEYYQLMLPDFVTGKLGEKQRLESESHLASCEECSLRRLELVTLSASLRSFRPSGPPTNYFNNVLPRLRERLDGKRTPAENPLLARILAPLGAMALVIGLLTQIGMNQENGLRSMLGTLKTDELADVAVEQAEHQSLYLIPSTESLAAALPDEAIDRKLAATILFDESDESYEMVSDLTDEQVKLILERLGERKIL
jgi:hypothetical protein